MAYRYAWLIAGLTLLGLMTTVLWLSPQFRFERSISHMPVLWLVAILVLAGVLLTALTALIERTNPDRWLLVWVVGLGLLLRLVLMPSTPILEDDFYRYLWDGAVVSEGLNPYEYSPYQAGLGEGPPALSELAHNTPLVAERINYPDLKTVYPPVAELGFTLAHWLRPWSLMAWKALLLVAECVTLGILLVILRHIGRSPVWVVLYWWNPLLVKEFFNSAHVDALMIPFVLAALLFTLRRRCTVACICLALATGVKVWPILLLPVVLKGAAAQTRRRWVGGGIFLGLVGLQFLPILASGTDETSGFLAYARIWEMNDALFMAMGWAVQHVGAVFGLGDEPAGLLTRFSAGLIVVGLSVLVSLRSRLDADGLIRVFLVISAAVFLAVADSVPVVLHMVGPISFATSLLRVVVADPRYWVSITVGFILTPVARLRFSILASCGWSMFQCGCCSGGKV